jgi:hypothetical protein
VSHGRRSFRCRGHVSLAGSDSEPGKVRPAFVAPLRRAVAVYRQIRLAHERHADALRIAVSLVLI